MSVTTSPSDQPRRFGKRFRATRVLKPGPGGETLRGIDAATGRDVVIRTVPDLDAGAVARLDQELATLAGLDSTELVRPITAGRQGTVLYSVLPYVPGSTLEAHLRDRSGPLTIAEAFAVGRGVLRALAVAHEHDFLHRDVRPSNVVVDATGRPPTGRLSTVTLVDFGVAQLRRAAGAPPEAACAPPGTPHRRLPG